MSALRKNDYNPRPGLAVLRDIVASETVKPANRNSTGKEKGQTQLIQVVFKEAREMLDMA